MSKAEQLLKMMTLTEKVGQLNQRLYGWQVYEKVAGKIYLTDVFKDEVKRFGTIGVIYGVFRADPWSQRDDQTGLSLREAKEVSHMIQAYLKENTRLKVPALLSEECPHGHQALDSLTTPTNFSVGCSWDPELYQKVQTIVADELAEKGAHLGLISTLDVLRDPRWGRSEECFSEDPVLTAAFTKAAVQGLQENNRVKAVLKHLAGQGNVMGGHNSAPVNIGERELREIHLPAVKAGATANAGAMMAAYNDIDGIFCHVNTHLLQEILRDEFQFEGAIMADGCALDRVADVCGNQVEAAAAALKAGVDISLWDQVYPHLEAAVLGGQVEEAVLDQAVLRVLKLKEELGLLDEMPAFNSQISQEKKERTAIQMAQDALVLLKNENILPLNKEKLTKIAVIGPHADNIYHQLGDYTPYKDLSQCVNVLDGIKRYVSPQVEVVYAPGSKITETIVGGIDQANAIAKDADVIIVTLGGASTRDFTTAFDKNGAALSNSAEMTSGENIDLADLSLPACQIELVKALRKTGKPIVAVLIEGRPHSLELIQEDVAAILFAGYPGQLGGKAIANVLFGANPNGRLAFSIPESSGQLPVYYNYRDTLFMENYADRKKNTSYDFGFGLSYTTFSFEVEAIRQEATIAIDYELANEGKITGAEIIQIYVHKYQGTLPSRKKELVAFEKVFLKAGEKKKGTLSVQPSDLQYLDEKLDYKKPTKVDLLIETSRTKLKKHIKLC